MEEKYTYLVIDSNQDTPFFIKRKIAACTKCQNIVSFTDSCLAYQWLLENHCDLVFLDVDILPINGFDLMRLVSFKLDLFFIIVATHASKYAMEAHRYYDLGLVDYLSKFDEEERFMSALHKFEFRLMNHKIFREKQNDDVISAASINNKYTKDISINEISFVIQEQNYSYIYTVTGEKYCRRIALTQLKEYFQADETLQISRNIIVFIDKIMQFSGIHLLMKWGVECYVLQIPIRKQKEIREFLEKIG
jgi:DNA-binding LytR/AlgR family response regulator